MQIKCADEENEDGSLSVDIEDISDEEFERFVQLGKSLNTEVTDEYKLFELGFIECLKQYLPSE